MMKVFFCISNLSVPTVLSQIKNCDGQYLIITDQPNIKQFFDQVLEPEKVLIYSRAIKCRKLLFPIQFAIKKRRIWKLVSEIKGAEVYFYFNAFGFPESWAILKLSKRNKIYYRPDLNIEVWKPSKKINAIVKSVWIWIKYKVFTTPLWTGQTLIYGVSDWFIKKINAKTINIETDTTFIESLIATRIEIPEIQVLYLTGGLIESKVVEKMEFLGKTDLLIDSLKNYSIYLKLHPRFTNLHSKEITIKQIPSFIPANLLYTKVRVVIGYSTAVLYEFANHGIISISLLDYYIGLCPDRNIIYKELLNQNLENGATIYFPKTLDEIQEYLKLSSSTNNF